MRIAVDTDVPVPSTGGRGGRAKYPFAQMEVGDSFAIPRDTTTRLVWFAARYFCRKHPERKFIVRKNEMRCWRIA